MKSQIRILMVEDVHTDFLLVKAVLKNGGLSFESQRVDSEAEFLNELEQQRPDVILSDHGLPTFDGFQALALARQRCPDVPFIFVTGAVGEEVAIESLRTGATDYVLKSQLPSLVPAIRRALAEAEENASRRQFEAERTRLVEELKEMLVRMKTLTGLVPVCAFCKRIRKHPNHWHELESFIEEHSEATIIHELCPECSRKYPAEAFKKS